MMRKITACWYTEGDEFVAGKLDDLVQERGIVGAMSFGSQGGMESMHMWRDWL